jgi:hypothetical protein
VDAPAAAIQGAIVGHWASHHRKRKCETLCSAGDAALLKGDIELAERLFVQADICDPRNTYPEARLRVSAVPGVLEPQGRRFDFLYTPTLRGLSTELSSLLPLHPAVFSVAKTELDGAIEHHGESTLLAKYQRQILNEKPDLKAGLVQHSFIADQLAGPEIAKRLAKITTRKLFIHGVRDPISLTVSDFNLELVARYCGAYTFRAVYPQTPFGKCVFPLAGFPMRRPALRAIGRRATYRFNRLAGWMKARHDAPAFSLDKSVMQKRLDEALSKARHFAVGNCYAQHFDEWHPVDLERRSQHVIYQLYELIGVDTGFCHEAFRASEGTTLHRLMVQNQLDVDAFGYRISLGLGFAERMMYSNTFLMSELLTLPADERFAAAGITDQRLCITVQRPQWRLLPREVRVRLIESESVSKFCNTVLIPAWLDGYARWQSIMARYLLRKLEPPDIERLRTRIGGDLELFLKRHPRFERLWPSSGLLLGR